MDIAAPLGTTPSSPNLLIWLLLKKALMDLNAICA
jgi:hypothetical protein